MNNGSLLLTRRVGESVYIGDDITVMVTGIKGHQATLAFRAPKEIKIHREEVYERIKAEGPRVQGGASQS